MKNIILTWLIFLISYTLFAQGYVLRYKTGEGTITQYTKYDITSDYGARGENSYWHRGIDYRIEYQPVGYRILSPCSGTVKKIQGARGYKYLIVEGDGDHAHFGYGHIFQTVGPTITEPLVIGNMALIQTQTLPAKWVILNIEDEEAYGIEEGVVLFNDQEYPVTNIVLFDRELAAIGNSMTEPNTTHIHLHLYAFRNVNAAIANHNNVYNNYDPLSVLNYGTHTQYTHSILEHEIKYGNSGNSYFKTRATMDNAVMGSRYPNAVMDVDLTELFIKPAFKPSENQSNWGTPTSSYQHYIGKYFTSYIDHGGRRAFNPSELYPFGITTGQGSTIKTGIEPIAYHTSNGHPWDNFYFSDFFPRIHKDHSIGAALQLARHNLETRYPDGDYEAHSRITTVKNHVFTTNEPYNFAIDNFLPFVQKVEAYGSLPWMPKYSREWKALGNGSFVIDPDPIVYLNKQELTVQVYTSEAMTRVSLKVNGYYTEQTHASNEAMTLWSFEVPATNLVDKARNKLEIDGFDLHNNPMQKNAMVIPIRQTPSSWSPMPNTGPDKNHEIQIGTPDIDFEYAQLGTGAYQFKAISPHPISQYNWLFGDGQNCYNCGMQVEHLYAKAGVYNAQLQVVSSLGSFNVDKEVIVNLLNVPYARFNFSPRLNVPNRDDEITVEVDFFDKTDGIVSTYYWDFGNGQTSTEKNPKGIAYVPYTYYTVKLFVTNQAGSHYAEEVLYFDPTTTPWAGLIAWRQTEYFWDFDVSVENLNPPYTYHIDYGDGYSLTIDEVNPYYRFSHYYYNYGRYAVTISITGKDANGQIASAGNVVEINAQPDELLVGLTDVTATGDKYPLTNVMLQPSLANGSGYDENDKFTLIYSIKRIGDPLFNLQKVFTHWGPVFPTHTFQFDKAGDYQVHLSIDVNAFVYSGHAYEPIKIVNAPKYIVANICCQPYQVCQGATNTYYGETGPAGAPGVADNQWFPTNVRWTLLNPLGNVAATKEESFLPEHYIFEKWFTHKYSMSGTYRLRLETWNNNHGYAENGLLDPKYKNTLPYYDVIEKEVVVTTNMAALEIVTDNYRYFTFNADGEPVGSSAFQISNPGALSMNWYIEVPQQYENWIQAIPSSGTDLKNGNMANVEITASQYDGESTRYGYFNIHGVDGQGNPVQGSPSWIQFEQWGTEGPGSQLVSGNNPNQQFGYSVSIDGMVAAIGAPGKVAGDPSIAFIYEKNHIGQWVQKARLMPPSGQKHFGRSVAIHGEYVIVASSWNAAMYKKPASGWNGDIQPLKVLESNITDSDYGKSVAIWGDYAVVGDRLHNSKKGCVYIYYRNQGGIDNWGRLKQLFGQSPDDFFGESLDIYNDLIAIGAPQHANNHGFIDVYHRNKNLADPWTLEKRITTPITPIGPDVKFGSNVSLFEDRLAATFNSRDPFHDWVNHFVLFERSVYRNWPVFDISGRVNSFNAGKSVSSVALYKELKFMTDEAIYNYSFRSGGPSFYNNTGSAFWSYFQFIEHLNMFSFNSDYWFPRQIELSEGIKWGFSIDQSYHSVVVGVPGHNGAGSAEFQNDAKRHSLCDAGINLVFENFTKPAGAYNPVNAHNITIGGNSMPAAFTTGSAMSYTANEIILKDGFLAIYGSDISIESENCLNEERNNAFRSISQNEVLSVASSPINQDEQIGNLSQNGFISIEDVIKKLKLIHPDFPWHKYNLYEHEHNIGIYDRRFKNLLALKTLSPSLLIDTSFEKYDNICVLSLNDSVTNFTVKFLITFHTTGALNSNHAKLNDHDFK